jgi:hypothetical protein
MKEITKKIKLIGGVLILVCCFLPFLKAGLFGKGVSINGFTLYNAGFGGVLSMIFILGGAAALIYVDVMKDIAFSPKFTLSFIAKLAVLAGGVFMLISVLSSSFIDMGAGLILVLILAVVLLFEGKIVTLIEKQEK